MKIIDDFLNQITMYRLVLYVLIYFLVAAAVLSLFNLLPFSILALVFSTLFLTTVCWIINTLFAKVFSAPTNLESVYITALILALIIAPVRTLDDVIFLGMAALLAMTSKYIIAIKKKHIFNPAAFAVVVLSFLAVNFGANWWVGSRWMMVPVLIGGLMVVRKIKRFSLVTSFLLTSIVITLGIGLTRGENIFFVFQKIISDSPLFFFSFIMLTEPLTSPPTKMLQIAFGALVGFLYVPQIHIGSFYPTSEIALLIGNIFAYIVSPKDKLFLKFKQKLELAPNIYSFIFRLDQKFSFTSGQYMEWTLGHKNPDSRGVRRYFSVASAPTEQDLIIGVKFYPNSSSFKRDLLLLNPGDCIVASQLSGEFTLPKDKDKKLAFLAGGIGVTPFRSIIRYLLDTNQQRDIIQLYSNKTQSEVVYKDIFDEALQKLGIKTIYVNIDTMGFIDEVMIKKDIPDYKERTFYISGPHSMVDSFEKTLKNMGISSNQIKTDFFPGYA